MPKVRAPLGVKFWLYSGYERWFIVISVAESEVVRSSWGVTSDGETKRCAAKTDPHGIMCQAVPLVADRLGKHEVVSGPVGPKMKLDFTNS